jgi:beta-alanine degradation protein BauB
VTGLHKELTEMSSNHEDRPANPDRRTTRRQVLAMLAALGVTRPALAQDAAASDPRSFRVVLENDSVRVLEYRSGPGLGVCGQGMHYHPDRVTVSLTGAKIRLAGPDGKTSVRDIPTGHVFYSKAETHSVENIGGAGTRTYIIELKDRNWQPSTG